MQQRRNQKDKALFEYTNKILAIQRAHFIEPFPKNIHELLTKYIQYCYYTCVFPFRLVYNSTTHQYETKTNFLQRIAYSLVWAFSMIFYGADLVSHIPGTKRGDPTGVLLLLGGVGHLGNFCTYLATTAYYREEIKNLINYFLLHSATRPEDDHELMPNKFASFSDGNSTAMTRPFGKSALAFIRSFTFVRIARLLWFVTLIAGIKSTEIDGKLLSGEPLVNTSDILKFFPESVLHSMQGNLNSSSFFSYILQGLLQAITFTTYMQKFSCCFIYGLLLTAVLTMKYVVSNFTRSLVSTTDFWKPTSGNILSSFLILRQVYRMVNRIFGWMLFYTIMGEFPNFTFSLVFWYKNPNALVNWSFRVGLMYILLILIIASLTINELSKLKEWMHGEHKIHWSLRKGDSLQRRIVLFELSLNRYALYAHGFFQLSSPAFLSIAAGMLSNTLIIIQLDLSKNNA